MGLKEVLGQYIVVHRPKYKGPYTRGVYPTQYTSRMGTVRVKQEEEADKNNVRVINLEERNVGTKGKSPKQNLTSAKDLLWSSSRDASPLTID